MIRRWVARALVVLRDGWLILGIAVALLLFLEASYRGQASLRRAIREAGSEPDPVPAGHPYETEAWWREWLAGAGDWRNRYDPYRGIWAMPTQGPYLNIDSLGRRRTVQPTLDRSEVRRRVYLLGGSTMFGYTSRDAYTIPSHLAALRRTRGSERSRWSTWPSRRST